ncbi:MAG: DUF4366 domain-containing protein [bacterium]|nr:DUF4366 domain-containing protein [bacterium]
MEHGRCSHCDDSFPLIAAKRPYVLLPARKIGAVTGDVPIPVGVDDPSLAAKVGLAEPSSAKATEGRPAVSDELLDDAPVADQAAEPATAESTPAKSRRFTDILVLAIHAGAGGGLAYYAAPQAGGDPVTWSVVGGVAGLAMGMAWIRWVARKQR